MNLLNKSSLRTPLQFEKECISEMARSTCYKYTDRLRGADDVTLASTYRVSVKIGHGFTYSKYNTLMHFLNVVQNYWANPDLSSIQVI